MPSALDNPAPPETRNISSKDIGIQTISGCLKKASMNLIAATILIFSRENVDSLFAPINFLDDTSRSNQSPFIALNKFIIFATSSNSAEIPFSFRYS